MFSVIVVPLLKSLKWINFYVGNYGWDIIILTVLINILILPFRHMSVVSMRKMQAIQPEVKAIQDRYAKYKATDPAKQKMNQEMMALYKERGVNPAGGCIPILLTFPLIFAFYALPDTITLIANALRAGSSFLQAIELVVRESRPPISTEFGRVIREVNLGLPFEQAMENMVRRVKSDDLELMATAISIQHTVGGNLAEILDSIAFTIRERVRIKGEIRTLTAQQRLSGYVVGFLPIGLAGFLFVAAPGFMEPMFKNPPGILGLPAGVIILAFGGFMMFIGFMIIRRIVDIEV